MPGLRLADHRRADERAVAAGIRDRERPALDVVGEQLLRPCALGKIGDAAGHAEQVEALGLLQHRDDQSLALVERDREAEVDVVVGHDRLAPDLGVHVRPLAQRLDRRARDEGEVGEVDAVGLLECGLQRLADRDDLRHVDLDRARHVRGGVERAAHVLGDAAAHRRSSGSISPAPGRRLARRLRRLASGRRRRGQPAVVLRGAGGGAAGGAAATSLAFVEASASTKARMSFFVTRPSRPVPGTVEGSMPCSEAIRATTGETNV